MTKLHHRKKELGAWSATVRQLFEIIDEKGLSQAKVLDMLFDFDPDMKVTQQNMSKYRMGRTEPGIGVVEDLLHVLGYELVVQKRSTSKTD